MTLEPYSTFCWARCQAALDRGDERAAIFWCNVQSKYFAGPAGLILPALFEGRSKQRQEALRYRMHRARVRYEQS